MDPVSAIPAIAAVLVALSSCLFLVKRSGPPDAQGRFVAIDGLRGYLAFGVFLHHSVIWFFYLRTGEWKVPPSNLYTHFGQTGVAFFFMITGFLFVSKVLDGRNKGVDWLRLYVSRFLRLMPLYGIAILALLAIVFILSHGAINESASSVAKEIVRWMSFTILGSPDINGIPDTWQIVAGVTWSLPYEWFFYFLLPLFGLLVGVRVTWPFIALGVAALFLIHSHNSSIYHWLSFAGGIAAAFVVRAGNLRQTLRGNLFSPVALGALAMTVIIYPSARGYVQILLLSVTFIIIAAGNGCFGLLTNSLSRTLGEMAYSIYLLHGVLLFVLFRFVIGLDRAKSLSPVIHWIAIIGLTPVLIGTAFICYKKIEYPALSRTNDLTLWLRTKCNFQVRAVDQEL